LERGRFGLVSLQFIGFSRFKNSHCYLV